MRKLSQEQNIIEHSPQKDSENAPFVLDRESELGVVDVVRPTVLHKEVPLGCLLLGVQPLPSALLLLPLHLLHHSLAAVKL